jgi:hypothetical protein
VLDTPPTIAPALFSRPRSTTPTAGATSPSTVLVVAALVVALAGSSAWWTRRARRDLR